MAARHHQHTITSAVSIGNHLRLEAVAVSLAVIATKNGGDGWESNPPRTPQQRPANSFEDRGPGGPMGCWSEPYPAPCEGFTADWRARVKRHESALSRAQAPHLSTNRHEMLVRLPAEQEAASSILARRTILPVRHTYSSARKSSS